MAEGNEAVHCFLLQIASLYQENQAIGAELSFWRCPNNKIGGMFLDFNFKSS
jgi:hypothetical protein